MDWESLLSGEPLTAFERANNAAKELRALYDNAGYVSMIHSQRKRKIDNEIEKLEVRLKELNLHDPNRYYDGDWNEVLDEIIFWKNRNPFDETQWRLTI